MPRTAGSDEVDGRAPPRPRHTGAWVLRTNTLSFYLRSRLVLEPEALRVTTPRTILGLVPIGSLGRTVPLDDLGAVRTGIVVHADRVLVAAALLGIAGFGGLPWPATLVLAAIAVTLLFLGIALGMRIDDRARVQLSVPVCVLQRGVAGAVVRQIERAIAAREGP